jgi:dihydroorotate dehydrogenase electron transfer subunit
MNGDAVMEQCISEILGRTELGGSYVKLDFSVPWKNLPVPGQFVSLGCGDDILLKRPFSIAGFEAGGASVIFKVVGKGTDFLSQRSPGDRITVLGPLGNGFPAEREHEVIYAGGGCGLPPLLYDISLRRGGKGGPLVFAGFRTASDIALTGELEAEGAEVRVVTEDGSEGETGLVTGILEKYLESLENNCIIFSSGPMAMQKAVASLCISRGIEGFLCLERYMACGIGACQSCVQPVRHGKGDVEYARVCVEGPVFRVRQIVWDE